MAMWAVTQTDRFAAAVAGAGIASWQSYYGQNKIDTWMLPFFGASVYDDPKVYAKSSPIEFIKKAKTPTLVLHGERDSEVPTPQGYEFWHALKTLGVPTQLVIYPTRATGSASRSTSSTSSSARGWFDKYLGRDSVALLQRIASLEGRADQGGEEAPVEGPGREGRRPAIRRSFPSSSPAGTQNISRRPKRSSRDPR